MWLNSKVHRRWLAVAIVIVACLDSTPARAQDAQPAAGNDAQPAASHTAPKGLTFCAEPSAMPRTGKDADGSPRGLDLAMARLVCEKLGRSFEVHWCASPACSRNCLRNKRCDVILGHPLDEGAPKDLAWSVPYAGSQFGLVVSGGGPRDVSGGGPRDVSGGGLRVSQGVRSLADLIDKRVGIVAGTVALPENKHRLVRFRTREELLDRFADERLDAAFIDADFAAWHLSSHGQLGLRLVADYVPREHWNLALAARATDAALLVELNKALAELAESGELEKTYAELGVPFRAAFTPDAGRAASIDTWQRIKERGELRVGIDPANLPYSSADDDRPGFDLELARELARRLGLRLRVEWLDVQRETAIGKLLEHECDLALGAAVEAKAVDDEEELAGKVIYSRPYYGTGYFLVTRKGGPRGVPGGGPRGVPGGGPRVKALAELKGERSRRLGAEAGSVADYRLRQGGFQRSLFRNQLAVLKALDDGVIDYAYLWANAGWTLHATPDFELELVPDYVPEDHWNIAVALRKEDLELKRRLDAALAELIDDGAVARAVARYHVPYFPPFDEGKGDEKKVDETQNDGKRASIRHPVAKRGIEPVMRRLQTSRNPYGGLERVRSAGALIVGLDQNNLPFSAAHPEPAGLDYEIAGLLAEKLGVSLRVYWAYSSHDSYPSKLATKKLCDVIMGVMPDDRFGDRVAFSKPYYIASYQRVVPADADAGAEPVGNESLAIEAGVAVHGPEGPSTPIDLNSEAAAAPRLTRSQLRRSYASTEEILEAVATNQAPMGYVISTRAAWLADRRWPGKLRFLDGDAADRLPICAAVRKADDDLKAAIDRALDELAKSGELAAVFARWKIPYAAATTTDGPADGTREKPSSGGSKKEP